MFKYNRVYELEVQFVQEDGEVLFIRLPFTLEFFVQRSVMSSSVNMCRMRVYNLSKETRNKLRFNISTYGVYRRVILKAGYGDYVAEIYRGNISQCQSQRLGTDWVTTLDCFDGGFAYVNGISSHQFPEGTTERQKIKRLIGDLPFVKEGVISNSFNARAERGNTVCGSTASLIKEITGDAMFIDMETVSVLKNDEYMAALNSEVITIDARNGLIGTPSQELTFVTCDMIFDPRLNIGEAIYLDSLTADNYNGLHKINAVTHQGTISAAVCGELITTATFNYVEGLKRHDKGSIS